MTTTPNLGLPYIDAAQAQKHVTHNEAIRGLDALVQTAIVTRALSAAPTTPADGACYILAATGTGAWTGQAAGTVAAWQDGLWVFYLPKTGWLAWIVDEGTTVNWTGTLWQVFGLPTTIPQFGINTAADATNKLSVASSAVLLNNIGNSVQLKLNKHAAADTASVLYQDNFSGRAETGLTGDDGYHFKVSPDGATWKEALKIDATSGLATVFGDPAAALGIATKQYVDSHSGTSMPGGTNGQIQYNNAGALAGFTAGGDAAINAATGAITIAANAVTNAKAAQMAAVTLKGNSTGATANAADLTAAQVKTLLAIGSADVSGLGALATASSVNLTTQATGTLQAAQEPAHTGDVTNTTGSLTLSITANAVTNAKLAQMAANTLKGNNTGSTANSADLTAAQVKTLLALAVADVSGAAPLASPALTGTPTAPTATAGTNSTQIASTAYVDTGLAGKAASSGGTLQNTALLGVNATADVTNKLAVASSAVLFNNIGNGIQAKFNKNAITDTASILYQTNFSGRAETGLTGDDSYHFKVSPDGTTWKEAININATSALATVFGDPASGLGIATKQYVDARSVIEVEIDFGGAAVQSKRFTIANAGVLATSKIVVDQSGKAATGRAADENEMDFLHLRAVPGAGSFTLFAACLTGRVSGKYKVNYLVG